MPSNESTTFIAWRFYLLIILILCCVLGLFLRIFTLTILDQGFLRHEGDERALRLVSAPAMRGMIVDRNGYPLAVSTRVYAAWANPQTVNLDNKQALRDLAKLLEMPVNQLATSIKRYQTQHRQFLYLKRGISPAIAAKIKAMQLPGIYLNKAFKRYYPEAEVMAHVVGFTNVDDQGQEGIELAYNRWLQGEPGKQWVIRDRLGRIINDGETVKAQVPGHDLMLSIDRKIQYLAYRALNDAIQTYQAQSGSAIVLDATTGEILAMLNYPTYNPNHKPTRIDERYRNRAVTDLFEPGSTIKAFTIASALDVGAVAVDAIINTHPGWMRVGHNVVRDERNFGPLSLAQILQVSSNMGVTKLILAVSAYPFWDLLKRLGFGEITGIEFPGEQSGSIVEPYNLGSFSLATLSFGYGISVTALQLARAYLVFANHGNKLPVTLLKLDKPPQGKSVLSEKIAQQMLALLETVVEKGTGKKAQVPGYRIAGKTGTTKLVGDKGYQKHRYTASFVGIAPVTQPKLVVAVIIHDPLGKDYGGGAVAGPVFAKIMEGSLRILNIAPESNT